ncbi:unnamed protein product, partial [Arabidopsis halleri]
LTTRPRGRVPAPSPTRPRLQITTRARSRVSSTNLLDQALDCTLQRLLRSQLNQTLSIRKRRR